MRANRVKNATQVHDMYSKQLLKSISGGEGKFDGIMRKVE